MEDKSYVTMAICPICQKETGTILLDSHLRPKFERHTVTPDPCDKCKKKYLKDGVLLFDPTTGGLVVLKLSAFKRMFNVPVPPKHIAFVEAGLLKQLQGVKQ